MAVFYFTYQKTEIPDANKAFEAQSTYVYYSGGKAKVGQFADQNRESIPLADVPESMQDAVIAAEDRTFYSNNGIDPKGILRAAFSNARGNATQGASTITQQYVKILYLSQERTLSRKFKEAFLSLKVQQEKSKASILEGYLNTIYFGRSAYGVQAASLSYFGHPAKQLTVPESAMLAAVLNSPNYLNPDKGEANAAALTERYDYVLKGMVSMGSLDAAEAEKYYGKLPARAKARTSNSLSGQRGFMLKMVRSELLAKGFVESDIDSGGLRIETTFTKKGMKAAEDAVLEERPEGLKKLHVATASVDVNTGALIGFYAGQDYLQSQLNWAQLGGSPGSAFKPFALAAAIKSGFSLKDTFEGNSPFEFENGSKVVNEGEGEGNDYGSAISLTQATEDSVNTAYADLTESLPNGPEDILKMAVALGVPRKTPGLEANDAIALGSATISPITMANAYATIANGGMHHDWFTIKQVTRASDGKQLYRAPRKTNRVLSEDISSDVSYAMQQVVQNGTGQNAQALGRPAAGKTGTATNDKGDVSSSWFVGYTPQVATAVMYVRGKGNEALNGFLPSYFGANYPTYTWRAVMSALLEGVEEEDFPPPANLDGEAPDDGHAPYTPPPSPTKAPEPKPKPKPKPTPTPVPTAPGSRADPARADPARPADVRPRGPDLPVTPDDPAIGGRSTGRAVPGGPGGAVAERGRRRPGGSPRPAAPVVDAGPGAARADRRGVRARRRPAGAVPGHALRRRPGPLREDVLLRRPLPLHRPRVLGRAVALHRRRRALPGDRVPRRHRVRRVGDRQAGAAAPGRPADGRAAGDRRVGAVGTARDAAGDQRLLPADRAADGAVRAGQRLAARGGAPATALGRAALRPLAVPAGDRAGQLGPAGGGPGRRGAVGVVARPAGAHRRPDRPRHGHQALPAVPARRGAGDRLAASAHLWDRAGRPLDGAVRGRLGVGGGQPPGDGGQHRAVAGVLELQLRAGRRPGLALAGALPRRHGGLAALDQHLVLAGLRSGLPRRGGARHPGAAYADAWRSWASWWWPGSWSSTRCTRRSTCCGCCRWRCSPGRGGATCWSGRPASSSTSGRCGSTSAAGWRPAGAAGTCRSTTWRSGPGSRRSSTSW